MYRRRRTATCLLVAAAVLLPLLASSSCAVSTHRLPRPLPPVLLGGGDTGTWGSFGRSRTQLGRLPEGRGELAARRLGQRESLDNPPSPKPHGMPNKEMPALPLPPPPPSVNE